MTSIEDEVTSALREFPDDEMNAAEDRVIARVHTALRRKGRTRVLAFGSGVAAAAAIVTGLYAVGAADGGSAAPSAPLAGGTHGQGTQPGHPPWVFITVVPGEPCPDAEPVTTTELAADVDVPVWMPDTANASVNNLSQAWVCGDAGALTFTNGVTTYYEPDWSDITDPATYWESIATARGGGGYVGTALGQPAFVGPAGTEYPQGEVEVIVDGNALMRVLGNGTLTDTDLLAIANSITVSQPLPAT